MTENEQSTRRGIAAFIEAARPIHWTKNVFVAAPLLFSGRFNEPRAWLECLLAVAAFCLLGSGMYLINDVCDRRQDQAHPVKRRRPIASGRLSAPAAVAGACALLAAGLAIVLAVARTTWDSSQALHGAGLLVWTVCYLVMNLLYSFWLKRHAIVDVLVVAMGFVLRAMAGAAAISVPISPWLVVCTLTLCLFIALAKRRAEIDEMPAGQAGQARPANRGYRKETLEHMLAVSAGLAIVTYCLYCLAPRTIAHIGSGHMVWTIPLVIYGTFRHYRNSQVQAASDAVSVLVRDRVMWLVGLAYVMLTGLIIKFGSIPAVRDILDIGETLR